MLWLCVHSMGIPATQTALCIKTSDTISKQKSSVISVFSPSEDKDLPVNYTFKLCFIMKEQLNNYITC